MSTNRNILRPAILLAITLSVLLIVARSREATPKQVTSPAANQPAPAYRGRFPDDPAMTDFDNWHVFETENPLTFLNMYQFWLQKPATSAAPSTPTPSASG